MVEELDGRCNFGETARGGGDVARRGGEVDRIGVTRGEDGPRSDVGGETFGKGLPPSDKGGDAEDVNAFEVREENELSSARA